jgi:hypothetical protein
MRLPKIHYYRWICFLLLTLVASFLGYHLSIKRQRQELLTNIASLGGEYQTLVDFESMRHDMRKLGMDVQEGFFQQESQVSLIRNWLGDAPVLYVYLPNADALSHTEAAKLPDLFPEAFIAIGKETMSNEVRFLTALNHAIKDPAAQEQIRNPVK